MPKAIVSILLAASAGATSSVTSAQEFRSTEPTRALFVQGYCAARHNAASARKVFTAPPGSKEEAKLIRSLTTQACGGLTGIGLPYLESERQLLRGVIAEAVLEQARKKKAVDPTVAPFGNLSADAIAALDAKGQASLLGLDFAQCVVAASPAGVKALLNTNPTWDKQDKAIQQLQPYLGPCLPKGAEVTYSNLVLRGLIAEAAYRSLYFTAAAGKN